MSQHLPGVTEVLKNGTLVPLEEAISEAKLIAVYYSAHWCPPCRKFTPVLNDFYNKVTGKDQKDLEIIFVSSDKNDEEFKEYFGQMSFTAVPYSVNRAAIKMHHGISGIPCL